MTAPSFSLKDQLFNREKVTMVANEIQAVYPEFAYKEFIKTVITRFPELELMERLYWLRECLQTFLPSEYRTAVNILIESLPPPLDPDLTDDDFGDFVYGAYGNLVAVYGATAKDVQFSLNALKEMTKRFTCEYAIREFINQFPEQTLETFALWSRDDNYHVRRLVSEGMRPKLPWGKNITIAHTPPMAFLDILHSDTTRYVTRSVANHLNDISKIDPELVLSTLKRWQSLNQQSPKELDFIVRHSLRTLVRKGHPGALQLLGFMTANVSTTLAIDTPAVVIGDSLEFTFTVTSKNTTTQRLLIDYILYFQKASGTTAPKTYKITSTTLLPGETLSFTKKQPLRVMTTRRLHVGKHQIELQINGHKFGKHDFDLLH